MTFTLKDISDEEFAVAFEQKGPKLLSTELNIDVRQIYKKRRTLEKRLQVKLTPPSKEYFIQPTPIRGRLDFKCKDGTIFIGSDAHYWPNYVSTAHRAFVQLIHEMKPKAVILNGDVLDGATISRHASIGWEHKPRLIDEIEACKDRLAEIEAEMPNGNLFWTLGNHDARFETRLANIAPEYAKVEGVHLKDHFPYWQPGWSVWINDNIIVKHRYKGGIHATHNNTVTSGKTIITGHLHSAKVTPFTDYNGTRWGVDCGTLADVYGLQFSDYMEDNPRNWRSGFCVLTIKDGNLLPPEIAYVLDHNVVAFRGEYIKL